MSAFKKGLVVSLLIMMVCAVANALLNSPWLHDQGIRYTGLVTTVTAKYAIVIAMQITLMLLEPMHEVD